MLVLDYELSKLIPAKYNPRVLVDEDFEVLKKSIAHGLLKPVIATEKGKIIAGHQRSKSAIAIGMTHGPVFVISSLTVEDEIRFNQLHNGTDYDATDDNASIAEHNVAEFVMVPHTDIEANRRSKGQNVKAEICTLIGKYGNWGCAVCTFDGRVISGSAYLVACKQMRCDARVRYVENEKFDELCALFHRTYGRFAYENLPKKTYVQSFAQMFRLRGGKRDNESLTYKMLIESTSRKERVFDFGCGQGDYVKKLKAKGYQIDGVEFFRRLGNNLDKRTIRAMCRRLVADLKENGRFDVVICDFVLNSINSKQAHDDVVRCVKTLCKPGGRVYISGRPISRMEQDNAATMKTDLKRQVEFLDDDGFSALYRKGNWFFQKFHTEQQITDLLDWIGNTVKLKRTSSAWYAKLVKLEDDPLDEIQASFEREFNLEWPGGDNVGFGEQAAAAILSAIDSEKKS